jgi:flagellar protein FlaG
VNINSVSAAISPDLSAAYRASVSPTQSLPPAPSVPGEVARERIAAEAARNAARVEVTEPVLQESVDRLNEFISPYVTSLQFQIDKDSGGKLVVRIMDTETKEVIKQFPNDKVLALAKALTEVLAETWDKPGGLLLEQEA